MSEEKIQVLKPLFRVEECLAEIRDCLESSWTGMGYKTTVFEQKWCEYTNLPHAHFLNSATAGLDLGVRILKEKYNFLLKQIPQTSLAIVGSYLACNGIASEIQEFR